MKARDYHLKRIEETEEFGYACRFLENKIIQNLKPDFSFWKNFVYGCSVRIIPGFGFSTRLVSFGMDFATNIVLQKIGFDTPCRTVGDIFADKLWCTPHEAILKFRDEHRGEYLEWLNTKECHNFLAAPDWPPIAASRGKEAV